MKRLTVTVKIGDEGNFGLLSNMGEAEFRINYIDLTSTCKDVLTKDIVETLVETARCAHSDLITEQTDKEAKKE